MLAARTGLSPVMVGRSGPLGRLTALLREPQSDQRPAVALVAGEAGLGKTRLVQELIAGAPPGTVVLAGGAEQGALGRPFEVVRSLLADGPGADGSPGGQTSQAIVESVVARVGSAPALIVFEDLHWADAESVAVFERLANAYLPRTLLIATARSEQLTRRLPGGEMLERLERRRFVHHVRLDPLSRVEVGAFLGSVAGRVPPSGVVDALHNRTGGNPFFLEEILGVAGDVDMADLARQPLPWSLAELVRGQLDGLSADERRVVEAAAVLGRRAGFDLLATVTRASEDELIDHLRALVARGLLIEEADDEFSFRHALVRDAVEGQLLGRERRRLHALALTALQEGACVDLADLARHAAGAGRIDDFVALARQGVEHYLGCGSSHQALRLAADALGEVPDDTALLAGAARAAWLLGLNDEALGHAKAWYDVASRSGRAEDLAPATRQVARLLHELARHDELWQTVAELEALAAALPTGVERARVMACLAQTYMLQNHSEEAVAWAEQAVDEADAVGAKDVRAQALVERGSALGSIPGRFGEGEAALTAGIAEAEAVEDWVLVARGLNNLDKYRLLTTPEGLADIERLRDAACRAGFDSMLMYNYELRLASRAFDLGDAAVARQHIARAADWAAGLTGHSRVWLAGWSADLHLEAGEVDAAARDIAAAERVPSPDLKGLFFQGLKVRLAVMRGDDAEARRIATALADEYEWAKRSTYAEDAFDAAATAEAAIRAGVSDDIVRAIQTRSPCLLPKAAAEVESLVETMLAARAGRHEVVVAAAAPPDWTSVIQRSAFGVIRARSLAALGRRAEALDAARAARALLDGWPGWRRNELDALIRRLESAGGSDGDGELTAREREVAALLAEGLTNAELARRLYISPKTAAVHVSNILGKLGMSSRAEVAAWAVRSGLAADGLPAAPKPVASGT